MKMLLEFLPIIVFFAGYKFYGLAVATIATMVVSVALLLYRYATTKTWDKVLMFSTALILIMGGLTLKFNNPLFIQYKLSVLYGVMVLGLWVSAQFFGRNWIAWVIRQAMPINEHTGKTLLLGTMLFFAATAILNILLINWLSFDTWVNVKTFGMTAALILFAIWQGYTIMQDPSVKAQMEENEQAR